MNEQHRSSRNAIAGSISVDFAIFHGLVRIMDMIHPPSPGLFVSVSNSLVYKEIVMLESRSLLFSGLLSAVLVSILGKSYIM